MYSVKIKLEKIADVRKFVTVAGQYKELDLKSGTNRIKAASLMGIFSLNLDNLIDLCYYDNSLTDRIRKDFERWIVNE